MAFKIAGSMAFKMRCQSRCCVIRTFNEVEVVVPEEYMGDVIGDINSRRGRIEGMTPRAGAEVIRAFVPLSEMFGYATTLRSKTQGRGNYVMQFDHYEEVPKSIQDKVIGERK